MGAREPRRERVFRWIKRKPYTFGTVAFIALLPLVLLILAPAVGLTVLILYGFFLVVWGVVILVNKLIDEAFL